MSAMDQFSHVETILGDGQTDFIQPRTSDCALMVAADDSASVEFVVTAYKDSGESEPVIASAPVIIPQIEGSSDEGGSQEFQIIGEPTAEPEVAEEVVAAAPAGPLAEGEIQRMEITGGGLFNLDLRGMTHLNARFFRVEVTGAISASVLKAD